MKILFFILPLFFLGCNPKTDFQTIWSTSESLGDVIRIHRAELESQIDNMGKLLPYAINSDGDSIMSQLLFDKEEWTHLLVDVNEKDDIVDFKFANKTDYPQFKNHVQVYLGKRASKGVYNQRSQETRPDDHIKMQRGPDYLYQGEGPIWENDLVGFRMYFDERNGYDIFGKTTSRFVANEISLKGNYHELLDWGMDVLKVGNSYGAGALGISRNDTLFHIGDAMKESFQTINNGPFVATFQLSFEVPKAFPEVFIKRTVSIIKGLPGYLTKNEISGGSTEKLVTGIVNLHSDELIEKSRSDYTIYATHDKQAELEKYLGMAIITSVKTISGQTPDADANVNYNLLCQIRNRKVF